MTSVAVHDMAEEMFASAAGVLSALVDREVSAGAITARTNETSITVGNESLPALVNVPAAGLSVVVRFVTADLAKVVEIMLGTSSEGGEMDAMQRSIVSETVSQISSAMAERLAQALKVASDGIAAEVPEDASAYPVPPFEAYEATLTIGGTLETLVSILFDGLALSRMNDKLAPAPAPPPPVAAPAAAPTVAASPPKRAAAPPPSSQPVTFAPMTPTHIDAAAPGHANLDLVHDIPLQISAVLGQTALPLRDVVALQAGSVFELDKLSTDPIDLYVNNILIARGEVVVVDDKFAVKISELNPSHEKS